MVRPLGWVALLALAFEAPGCAENEVSFFIRQNQLAQPSGMGVCVVNADPSSAFSNEGVLDVALRTTYVLHPLYQSELLETRDPNAGRAAMRGIFVEGAEVELHVGSADGPLLSLRDATGAVTNPYTVTAGSDYVPAGGTTGPGLGVGRLELIPARVGAILYSRVCMPSSMSMGCAIPASVPTPTGPLRLVARIQPFGRTMGGIAVSGAWYTFPLTVCCGCLVTFPSDADDPMTPQRDCSRGAPPQMLCDIGQDQAVDCRVCAGINGTCQPTGNCT